MHWKTMLLAVGVSLALNVAPAAAQDGQPDAFDAYDDSHPLQLIAYPLSAAGFTLEWLIARPVHALVSRPALKPVFGRDSWPDVFDEHAQLKILPERVRLPLTGEAPGESERGS